MAGRIDGSPVYLGERDCDCTYHIYTGGKNDGFDCVKRRQFPFSYCGDYFMHRIDDVCFSDRNLNMDRNTLDHFGTDTAVFL